jgi:cytochrome c oxidase accessory protein FixG
MSKPAPKVSVIHMYAAREEIYARETTGRYTSLRWLCVWATQLVYYGLPWLTWNDRPAVLFDLGERKFYLFGLVLWPQDFIYLAALLIICAFGLFLVTAIAGRVWCGFGCPQTVYTEIFMWIERKIEGTRSARMRLDRQPASLNKFAKKTAKHTAWIALALWTGFTFVAYFTPARELLGSVATLSLGPWEWFWILFYSLATYGNAGWLREQVCKYMCPYARFQSAMFDPDSLIVTYDSVRGEPRGAGAKNRASNLGSCIDCSMCVQVCPTGIDIRNGLQYECIGCGACVDACDSVMDKVNMPRGLIRYASQNAVRERLSTRDMVKRVLRPRVLVYSSILVLITVAVATSLAMRTPLKVDVIRDRGVMLREVEDGMIENVYRLQIMNTDEAEHTYRITVSGIESIALASADEVTLGPTASRAVPVKVRVAPGNGKSGANRVMFELRAVDNGKIAVREKAVFYLPRQ